MATKFDSPIPRRSFLFGTGLAAAGLALPSLSAAGIEYAQGGSDAFLKLDDPKENLRNYARITGDSSGRPYVGWYAGHVFAIEQGRLTTPLFAIEGFGQGWMKPTAEGGFRNGWKEVGFYKDLATNQFIEEWNNPLNHEHCEVMHIHNRSVNITMKPHFPDTERYVSGGPETATGLHGTGDDTSSPFILRWFVHHDTVAVTLDSRFSGPNPLDPKEWPMESTGGRISVSEFFMQIADRRELHDVHRTSVHNVGQWTRICPWLPWMLMGQAPGQLLYRCVTKKLTGLDQLPDPLLAYTEKHLPEFLKVSTDEDFLLPPESSWEVFKQERKPHQKKT